MFILSHSISLPSVDILNFIFPSLSLTCKPSSRSIYLVHLIFSMLKVEIEIINIYPLTSFFHIVGYKILFFKKLIMFIFEYFMHTSQSFVLLKIIVHYDMNLSFKLLLFIVKSTFSHWCITINIRIVIILIKNS